MVNCTVRACLKYLIMIVIDKTRLFQPCMFFLIFDKENTKNAAWQKLWFKKKIYSYCAFTCMQA